MADAVAIASLLFQPIDHYKNIKKTGDVRDWTKGCVEVMIE